MRFRIYADEAGTHGGDWLVIGMLFVPDHGALHSALCKVKEDHSYFNASPKRRCRYKETHLADFKAPRDVDVGTEWLAQFNRHNCYYRCVVINWSIWDGSYFGDPFEQESLQKRRAYKKWAEMLLRPELTSPCDGRKIYHAQFYLDRLRTIANYDVLEHLKDCFTRNYKGESPYIDEFQHTDSWVDANQCLQLCDLLTGCVYQSLVPSGKEEKCRMRLQLEAVLKPLGVDRMAAGFWRQYAKETLTKHFPKFSVWFWKPSEEKKRKGRRGNKTR